MQGSTRPLAVVAAVVFASIAVPASPAFAEHETWGWSGVSPSTAPPGSVIDGSLRRQISHDVPALEDFREDFAQPIREADAQCGIDHMGEIRNTFLDETGRVLAASPSDAGHGVRIPDFIRPSLTYFLRQACDYGQGDFYPLDDTGPPGVDGNGAPDPAWAAPEYRLPEGIHWGVACTRYTVTSRGTAPGPRFEIRPGEGSLRRAACPFSMPTIADRFVEGLSFGVARASGHFAGLFTSFAPPAPPSTTTTTRAQSAPTTAPPAQGDSTPPQITSFLVFNTSTCPNTHAVSVGAQVSDNVGVTSVSYSWNTSGGLSGSGTMSGGPTNFTGTISIGTIAGGQTITVTATARDAAGNTSAPASQTKTCGI